MDKRPRPMALIILDGWGHRDNAEYNAIAAAHKPTWDMLWERFPHRLIVGSGHAVGLPEGQMGNSEVGHLNMGAGRVVQQDLTRIDDAIKSGEFFKLPALCHALQTAKKNGKAVHVMGLLSPGGVHSHEAHFHALVQLAAELGVSQLYFHAFLDGRDTPPRSAQASLKALDACCARYRTGQIVSLIGRYFAMDRDKRWDRVQAAYDLIVTGKAPFQAEQAETALALAYARGESDEFVQATSIHAKNASPITVNDGDIVIFMNFRADRARQLTQAFVDPNFDGFKRRHKPALGEFLCLAEYDARFNLPVIFSPISLHNILGEYISHLGLRQLRIAETEKYAHVTFFFNGGRDEPYPGEDRLLIPSPQVATYDLQPEMSAPKLADEIVSAINRGVYDLIVCNFANADMVGHTGNFEAAVAAIQAVDEALKKIFLALQAAHGEALITADHGNAEQMYDPATNQAHTAHTSEDVPLIYIGRPALMLPKEGKLSDIAPTLLYLLGLEIPPEMTGSPLLGLV